MEEVKVKIVNKSENPFPAYATSGSAGLDLRAWLPEGPVTLRPLERRLVPTGLSIELPEGYEAQIRPRSGLALKHGISIVNAPGTIDSDYRGDIGVILVNLGDKDFEICSGDRICQMVVARYSTVSFVEAEKLTESGRESGGFGHTGKK